MFKLGNNLLAKSREEGRLEGIEEGRAIGIEEGRTIGRAKGRIEGRAIGRIKADCEAIENMRRNGFSEEMIRLVLDGADEIGTEPKEEGKSQK